MKIKNRVYLACIFLILQNSLNAQDVKLRQVTQHFGDQGALEWVRIYNVRVGEKAHEFNCVFTASKYERWMLQLRNYDASYTILPLKISEEEMLGDHGLLLKCIDKFLKDVPDADVNCITIEARSIPSLWNAFVKQAQEHFNASRDSLEDVKAVDRTMAGILTEASEKSADAKALGEKFVTKTGKSQYRISAVREQWEIYPKIKVGEKLSSIAELPTLGYKNPPSINYYLR